MHRLAIIPARGGSKRIPHKNSRLFLGKPIMVYGIETALASGLFDEVMVSTDDSTIATIALEVGAVVPFMRSEKNADDFATTFSVIQEVLATYRELGKEFDQVCCIYPTAPLMTKDHLSQGLTTLEDGQFDSVFAAVSYGHPVWRGFEVNQQQAKMLWPEYSTTRTQDLKPVFHDAGQWYWLQVNKIKDSIFTLNTGAVLLSELEVQDIDSLADWKLAELKYKMRLEE